MNPKAIADSFYRENGNSEGSAYLGNEGLLEALDSAARKDAERIPPKWADLARLHSAIRTRKVLALVDGRTSNARFIAANLYRSWSVDRASSGDITVFELQEAPLGTANSQRLLYCLEQRALEWTEPLGS